MTIHPAPRVSVVVPTWRRPDLLARCLAALGAQTLAAHEYEIIVCDDGPSADTLEVVREAQNAARFGTRIRYVEVIDTQGPAAARNQGWRLAVAPVIAFTDDDTVPDPQWLAAGLAAIDAGADAVTGRIEMPLPPRPSDIELDAAGLTRAEFVTANCFVRLAALKAVGGFDERFGMAWREDSDLHFNLLEAGATIVHAPDALVVHPFRALPFAAGIKMQKKVMFDVLLYGKHPRLYRQRIRPSPPWLYLAIALSLPAALVLGLAGSITMAALLLAVWGVATLWFFAQRLSRSAPTVRNVAELFITSIAIPPLSIFWRLVGIGRFGARFP